MKYRPKESDIEVFQWNGETIDQLPEWISDTGVKITEGETTKFLLIHTKRGREEQDSIYPGGYVVRPSGSYSYQEVRCMGQSFFESRYEKIDE